MRNVSLALLALIAFSGGLFVMSCGEVDPALAPAGSVISILGSSQTSWQYSCHEDSELPIICYDTWRNYLITYCQQNLAADPNSAVQDCIGQPGGTLDTCTLLVCDTQNYWLVFAEDRNVLRQAQANISVTPGACGYLNTIVSAFVTMAEEIGTSGGGSAGATAGSGTSGGEIEGIPLNDIEVRFIAEGGEMYKLSDLPSQVPPLANPYMTATDDRGKADIKYRTPLPTFCDYTRSFILSADIGVSIAYYQLDFTVASSTGGLEGDDDDDATQ